MKRHLLLSLLLTACIPAFAQKHTVTGKVLDETGQGFPGAGILVRGTVMGTVTDVNGDFMLDVPDGTNTLQIQALGYNSINVTDSGQQTIMVRLRRSAKELEGAVVTALGIRREKRELGYNATTINNEELTAGNNTSAIGSLQGKVAGANITSSTGGPGGSTRVVLRGEKSILKNNNALIIVDGIITNNYDRTLTNDLTQVDFGNAANDLDPDEIESVTVLEGPAAAVLYGEAGANGAIMYTTKKGRHNVAGQKSKIDVTYKATYTQSDILKYSDLQNTYGQGNIYDGIANDRRENFSWGLPFDNKLRPWGQIIDGKQLVKPYSAQPDNVKSFFNHGKDLNNFVSLSGGSEASTYYLSISSLNSSGVVPNTFYNKYSVRFNGTTQLSNNFYSTINFNYINTYSRVENSGQATGSVLDNLYETARDIPIWELKDLGNKYYSQQYTDATGVERYGYYGAYTKNPYWLAQNYDNRNKTDRILGDVNIGYKKGSFNVYDRIGVDVASDRSIYETPNLNGTAAELGFDPSSFYLNDNSTSAGGLSQFNLNAFSMYNDLIFNFKHELSKNFGIDAILGDNIVMTQKESLGATIDPGTNGLVIPNYYNFTNNVGPVTVSNATNKERRHGIYADIKLNFQRELFLEITGRNDWSSTLQPGHWSYFYPGANASWVFTERLNGTSFKDKVLNYGKIRAGLAAVGHGALPYANNMAGFNQSSINTSFGSINLPFNGVPGYQPTASFGVPNDLRPEHTKEFEAGTDLSFLKDRLSFSFTYYNDLTVDLITLAPVSTATGYSAHYLNVGNISNKGVEITLRGTPIQTKWGLKWDLFGTFTKNNNNVESLTNGLENVSLGGFSGLDIVAAVGHPFGTFYGADIQYHNGQAVVDKNGLPIATTKPVYLGSYQPKFIASWGTDLSWKGLRLHVLFTTKQGGEFYSRTKVGTDFNGTSLESTVNNRNPYVWNNSVQQVGNTNNYVTNTTKFSPYSYYTVDEQNNLPAQGLVNASYIRLQELSLYYKIPQKYYKRTPFGGLEAGVFGNNLLLWTAPSNKYNDPEEGSSGAGSNGQGFDFTARPSLRNYGVSLKVTF